MSYSEGTGVNNRISRPRSTAGDLENYTYMGVGTIIKMGHPMATSLTYDGLSTDVGEAGDRIIGLDRFGRVIGQKWIAGSPVNEHIKYGYDANGNRLYRENILNAALSELYTYDGLNQISSFARGTLNATKDGLTGAASRTQGWQYDALGNWTGFTTNGTTQTRTANAQNEYTGVTGATTPVYSASGVLVQRFLCGHAITGFRADVHWR